MTRTAWETAFGSQRRVFFEPATDTIRLCPENYCLLVRRDGQWVPAVDAAVKTRSDTVRLLIEMGWRGEMDGDVLADAVEEAFYGSQPIGGSR